MHHLDKSKSASLLFALSLFIIFFNNTLLANDNYQALLQQRNNIDKEIGFYRQILDPNLILSYDFMGIRFHRKNDFQEQFVSHMINSGWPYDRAVAILKTYLRANQFIKNEVRREIQELERQRYELTNRIMDATPVPAGRRQITEAVPPSPIPATPSGLSGRWISSNGDSWTITQNGSNLGVSQSGRGSYSGSFTGQNTIFVKFYDDGQQGCCSATVTDDRKHIRWNNNTSWSKQ